LLLVPVSDMLIATPLQVSYSDDVDARSMALLFLGAMAPLVTEEKHVHDLLLESLDTDSPLEVDAAITVLGEFGSRSL